MKSAIKNVSYYVAGQIETCDRCGQGIKRVAVFTFQDGVKQKVGWDCAERILGGDKSVVKLVRKNVKTLLLFKSAVEILSRPHREIPADERGYYDRGIYFIAYEDGRMMTGEGGCGFFHPTRIDDHAEFTGQQTLWKNGRYIMDTREQFQADCLESMHGPRGKQWFIARIAQIERFLTRAIAQGLAKEVEAAKAAAGGAL